MCPDRKLEWFKAIGYTTQEVKKIKEMVTKCWKELYKVDDNTSEIPEPSVSVLYLYLNN
jgi:hypothetical protein